MVEQVKEGQRRPKESQLTGQLTGKDAYRLLIYPKIDGEVGVWDDFNKALSLLNCRPLSLHLPNGGISWRIDKQKTQLDIWEMAMGRMVDDDSHMKKGVHFGTYSLTPTWTRLIIDKEGKITRVIQVNETRENIPPETPSLTLEEMRSYVKQTYQSAERGIRTAITKEGSKIEIRDLDADYSAAKKLLAQAMRQSESSPKVEERFKFSKPESTHIKNLIKRLREGNPRVSPAALVESQARVKLRHLRTRLRI